MSAVEIHTLKSYQNFFSNTNTVESYLFINMNKGLGFDQPFRSDSFSIGYLRKGSLEMHTGLNTTKVSAPALITLAPSVIRSFAHSSDEISLDIMFFNESFFIENQTNVFFMMECTFFEDPSQQAFELNEAQDQKISSIFILLSQSASMPKSIGANVVRSYIYVLITEIQSGIFINNGITKSELSEMNPKMAIFRKLLNAFFLTNREVGFYADKMNITPKHLSFLTKKYCGKTASQMIAEVVLLEAKVLLQNMSLSVLQVSEQLNFTDRSVFGKFFKIHTGVTPMAYRKRPQNTLR